ncbi:hypothetical protein F2Q69_00010890 [Brassica cretica]|uniref:Uncharacterized protein n=1 Tax=Brassica cretica TaxID=69181 RepID=A0A8S9QS59_BRACR|nr:hypothetical protein F2Q69_00010890 [Brassica cretica]
MFGKKNVTRHDLEIKPCSSLGWIKHKLSQGNRNVSKPATNRFECDDRNTDKPSSVTTQRPNMHTARSLRSDRARVPLGRYVPTEHASHSVATSAYPKGNLHFENGENLVAELIRVNARLLHIRRRCCHSAAALYRLNDA